MAEKALLREKILIEQIIIFFDYVCPHLTQVSFRMNAIVKNGPVVEPRNFELGIGSNVKRRN
jgi:hypothetical protein